MRARGSQSRMVLPFNALLIIWEGKTLQHKDFLILGSEVQLLAS